MAHLMCIIQNINKLCMYVQNNYQCLIHKCLSEEWGERIATVTMSKLWIQQICDSELNKTDIILASEAYNKISIK